MIQFLIRRFVKNADKTDDPKVRTEYGKLASFVGMACNLLLFVSKLLIGILAQSISIMADAVNNLSDMLSNLIALVGFRIAAKPADKEHPYGHARFEYISGLAIAALMLAVGYEFITSAVQKIMNPESVVFSYTMIAVLVLSIVIKFWMSRFFKVAGDRIDSSSLKASVQDSLNDVVTTSAVLIAMIIEKMTGFQIDGFCGLLVAAWILYGTFGIIKETISRLMGEGADPELVHRLAGTILNYDKRIMGIHDLMVHDYGPGQRFATVHLEMDAREEVLKVHELLDDIERVVLKEYGIQIVIHYDPVVKDDPEQNRARYLIKNLLFYLDPRIKFHDFRIDRHREPPAVVFDCVLPDDLLKDEFRLRNFMINEMRENGLPYEVDVTFDTQNFNRGLKQDKLENSGNGDVAPNSPN